MTNGPKNNLNNPLSHLNFFQDDVLLPSEFSEGISYSGLLNIYDPLSTEILADRVVKNNGVMILKDNLRAIDELNKLVLNTTVEINSSIVKNTILYTELQEGITGLDMRESVDTSAIDPKMLIPEAMLLALQICSICPTVNILDLSDNNLGSYVLPAAAMIAPNITALNIHSNDMESFGPDFASIIATSNITELDVGSNMLGVYGPDFVKNLANSKIITLSIDNNLFEKTTPIIAFCLSKLNTLQSVTIGNEDLTEIQYIDIARSIGLSHSVNEVIMCWVSHKKIIQAIAYRNKEVSDNTLIEYLNFVSRSLYSDKLLLKLTTEKALLSKEEIIKLGNNIVETYLPSVLEPSATLIAQYVQGDVELSGEYVIEDIELIFDIR